MATTTKAQAPRAKAAARVLEAEQKPVDAQAPAKAKRKRIEPVIDETVKHRPPELAAHAADAKCPAELVKLKPIDL